MVFSGVSLWRWCVYRPAGSLWVSNSEILRPNPLLGSIKATIVGAQREIGERLCDRPARCFCNVLRKRAVLQAYNQTLWRSVRPGTKQVVGDMAKKKKATVVRTHVCSSFLSLGLVSKNLEGNPPFFLAVCSCETCNRYVCRCRRIVSLLLLELPPPHPPTPPPLDPSNTLPCA